LIDILEDHYPVIRDGNTGDEPFGVLFGYSNDYSAIISTLRVGLQPLGILILAHPQPGRYGNEAQSIVATFASYAAVAIKNTQLYEAAHDQAWVSTVLLQASEATQSVDNLDDLLQTVVHIIPQLVGVDSCAILLRDRNIEAFLPFSAFGLSPEQQASFDKWYIQENDDPAFDQMLTTRRQSY
jgi:GAF domain-containing protein